MLNTRRLLGRFEIVSAIGAGGMGEVYLARDPQLGRNVALKVLHAEAIEGDAAIRRFEREAQFLASMSHPHVGAIYGLERSGDLYFLVLEFVPGETLDVWLRKRPGRDDLLRVFLQIAEGLEAAHAHGIVHRDLKSSNVKITPSGMAKILDFGIAEMDGDAEPESHGGETLELRVDPSPAKTPEEPESSDRRKAESDLRPAPMVGTLCCMSPEQARGERVTAQSDIWAYGCLLFEALCRQPAFKGATAPDLLAAILHSDPDWSRLPLDLPPRLKLLLRRCLTRDPHRRLKSIGDARLELQDVLEDNEISDVTRRSRTRGWMPVLVLALLAVGAVGLISFRQISIPEPSAPLVSRRLQIGLPADAPLWLWWWRPVPALALSPGGERLVYVADRGLGSQLYLRQMDRLDATPIPGTEEARHPFFSPDGTRVAFFTDTGLKATDLAGGRSWDVCPALPESSGGSWSAKGYIYFSPSGSGAISRVSDTGGKPEQVTHLEESAGERAHVWPEILPGDEALIYNIVTDAGLTQSRLVVEDLQTHKRALLAEGGSNARMVNDDRIVYADAGKLLTLPFDLPSLSPKGAPRTLVEGVRTESTGAGQYAISNDGTLAYVPGGAELGDRTLVWANADGQLQSIGAPQRNYHAPRLSPDGRRIVVEISDAGRYEIWIYDNDRGTMSRLTFQGNNFSPIWTPDGREITFVTDRDGRYSIVSRPFDDSGPSHVLVSSENSLLPSSWSPGGKHLAYYERSPQTQLDIRIWNEGEKEPVTFLATPASELKPMFSPDGNWIAYTSDESGRREIYLSPFPEGKPSIQVSTDGGREPEWQADGRALYYREGDSILRVPLEFHTRVEIGEPRMLSADGARSVLAERILDTEAGRTKGREVGNMPDFRLAELRPRLIIEPAAPGDGRRWRRRYAYPIENRIFTVDLLEASEPRCGPPISIFKDEEDSPSATTDFDIRPGDNRLLMVHGAPEQPVVSRIAVILNAFGPEHGPS